MLGRPFFVFASSRLGGLNPDYSCPEMCMAQSALSKPEAQARISHSAVLAYASGYDVPVNNPG